MSPLGSERGSVQNPLIGYVREESTEYTASSGEKIHLTLGWEYVSPEDALKLRGGETVLVFKDVFISQICKLNAFMTPELAGELIRRFETFPANIEGNLIAWEHLRGIKQIYVPDEKRERDVKLIDSDTANNTFHVTDEFTFSKIRADVVFLINGIPVFIVETKAAHKLDGIAESLDQIRRYHREGAELLSVIQVYALTHIIRYYYGATWDTTRKGLFNWKEEQAGDFEQLVKSFFDKERVIRILKDFILFTRQDDELKKVVLRPHQMRSVQKVVERSQDTGKKKGLIWHTQGSGKTYTMITAAQKIIENQAFDNPTVILLVDRNELESQLFTNLTSVGFRQEDVEIKNKKALQKALKDDKRGLIVTMIHKFEGIEKNINQRENIFVLVDEAHRTTGGMLGNYLMGAIPNATYIGFTGTPIDRTQHGKGTFLTFGTDDPPKGYLDKYSISESIEDGTTVPLHYTLAPNDLLVNKEVLEKEFLDLAEAEGISDIEELNKVLAQAVNLKNMLKNEKRVDDIAKYVAEHFRENVEPMGYKAFLVAVDRPACVMYKEALDKYLPMEYSTVVYSRGQNDEEELTHYYLSDDDEKIVRKSFRKPDDLPKILIVTEKLLTGFDAPILYCMYLDKPMRDHSLLQAIARVNRPYEDEDGRKKPSGFILDFVGIFGNLEKALAFDSSDIEGVVEDVALLKDVFKEKMEEAHREYLSIIKGKSQDKAVEAILDHFMDEEKRHEYYQFFTELSNIYEIISPDAFLRPYIEDFDTLARIYRILKEAFEPRTPIDKEFMRKTAKLVQKHTESGAIKTGLDVYEINEDTLRKIEESKASDKEKVFNLLKSIMGSVLGGARGNPFLVSIGEKAEELAQRFKAGQDTAQRILEELKKLIKEINDATAEQKDKKMPSEVFAIYWLFRKEGIKEPEEKANEMKGVFEEYPHWKISEAHDREIRKVLYKILVKSGVKKAVEFGKKIMDILKGKMYS